MSYVVNILIALDQVLTTLVGGFPDESLSSYAYRLDVQRKPGGRVFRPLIDWMFSWQGYAQGHCRASYESERDRMQFPPDLR